MLSQFAAPVHGGEERSVEALSRHLASRGHDVTIATLRIGGAPAREDVDGVHIRRLESLFGRFSGAFEDPERRHLPPLPDPQVTAGLRRVLAEVGPDVVHAHNWIVHSYLPLHRRNGPPLVLSLHDYSLVCANKRLLRFGAACSGPALAKCLRCAAGHYGGAKGVAIAGTLAVTSPILRHRVDMFLPVSGAVAETLRLERRGLPFEVLPNIAAESENGLPVAADPELVARLPKDGFVLFLGDATDDKGASALLEAHLGLDERSPLVFIGRPFALTGRSRPPDVHVLGPWPHDSALEAVARCSMLVSPSLVPETFGLAALEAMARARPVVASRIGGLQELVADGETGTLVPPGDVPSLRAAIAELAADRARREAFGRAGRERAKLYSWTRIVPRLEEVYGALIEGRRAASRNPGATDVDH
jgi:glycosyltransferase involved in cell wall biosynthesis